MPRKISDTSLLNTQGSFVKPAIFVLCERKIGLKSAKLHPTNIQFRINMVYTLVTSYIMTPITIKYITGSRG